MSESVRYVKRTADGVVLPVVKTIQRGPRKRPRDVYLVEDGDATVEASIADVVPLGREGELAERAKIVYGACSSCGKREVVGKRLICESKSCPRETISAGGAS